MTRHSLDPESARKRKVRAALRDIGSYAAFFAVFGTVLDYFFLDVNTTLWQAALIWAAMGLIAGTVHWYLSRRRA